MKQSFADLKLETKADAPEGTFEGYGAVFGNVDRDGDIVAKGAFTESLKARLPALLWQHNAKEPIGRFDVVREDEKGLFVKGRLSTEGRGREAYDLLKMGALDGLSIGFVTKEAQRSRASGTRTITKADLMEVSLVTFPANEMARVSGIKQRTECMQNEHIDDPRTFERFLRENGFSRSRAKAITAKGFGVFRPSKQTEDNLQPLIEALEGSQQLIQTKAFSSVISVYDGQTKTGGVSYSINEPRMTVEVRPRDNDVSFNARVKYHYWHQNGKRARDFILYGNGAKGHFRETVSVRENSAGWAEQILGGRHGGPMKVCEIEIESISGSTTFDVRVSQ